MQPSAGFLLDLMRACSSMWRIARWSWMPIFRMMKLANNFFAERVKCN